MDGNWIHVDVALDRENAQALLGALDQSLEALRRTECADCDDLWSVVAQKEKEALISVLMALKAALSMKPNAAIASAADDASRSANLLTMRPQQGSWSPPHEPYAALFSFRRNLSPGNSEMKENSRLAISDSYALLHRISHMNH